MVLRIWWFITVVLTSLLMTMGFTHLWQMLPRLAYDGTLWFQTLNMYWQFGREGPGPFIELGALVSAVVLVFLVHARRPAFVLSLTAVMCLVVAFATWWAIIYPVNLEMLSWAPEQLPANWTHFRDQWEYAHGVRAILQFISLIALLISLIAEVPVDPHRQSAVRDREPYPIDEQRRQSA